MAITFAYRSQIATSLMAYHATEGATGTGKQWNAFIPSVIAHATTGVLGGEILNMDSDTTAANRVTVAWNGRGNMGNTLTHSVLLRAEFADLSDTVNLWATEGHGGNRGNNLYRQTGQLNSINYAMTANAIALFVVNVNGTGTITASTIHDMLWTWTGQTGTGDFNFYIDGVLVDTANPSADIMNTWANGMYANVLLGGAKFIEDCRMKVNEFVIWDEIINGQSVTVVDATTGITSTGNTLSGTARTGWVDVANLDANNWTSITAAQISDGVEQIQAGLTQTGTFTGDWTSITAAQIASGVEQVQAGLTQTGTFAGETWSTLAAGFISSGVNQIQNSATITGTLVAPVPVGGTSTIVNIPNIKELIRFILSNNNTTTSSIGDLSANMDSRVQRVVKINPEKLPLQPSIYPCVTVFTDRKSVDVSDISVNQVEGKRRTALTFKILGIVFNTDFQTDVFNDPADEDLEKLMENVEGILRNHPDLSASIKWQFPTDVLYHSTTIGEDAHMRVGELTLQATLFY